MMTYNVTYMLENYCNDVGYTTLTNNKRQDVTNGVRYTDNWFN